MGSSDPVGRLPAVCRKEEVLTPESGLSPLSWSTKATHSGTRFWTLAPEGVQFLALIALDIGLAIQHFVDPEDAPLDLYPELYVLLFSPLSQEPETPCR
jgi:hypothetical protein